MKIICRTGFTASGFRIFVQNVVDVCGESWGYEIFDGSNRVYEGTGLRTMEMAMDESIVKAYRIRKQLDRI